MGGNAQRYFGGLTPKKLFLDPSTIHKNIANLITEKYNKIAHVLIVSLILNPSDMGRSRKRPGQNYL